MTSGHSRKKCPDSRQTKCTGHQRNTQPGQPRNPQCSPNEIRTGHSVRTAPDNLSVPTPDRHPVSLDTGVSDGDDFTANQIPTKAHLNPCRISRRTHNGEPHMPKNQIERATATEQRNGFVLPDFNAKAHRDCPCGRRAVGPIHAPKNGIGYRFCADHQITAKQDSAVVYRQLHRARIERATTTR